MTTGAKESKPRWRKWAVAAALFALLCIVAPPFRIVKAGARKPAAAFDAKKTAREFWETRFWTAGLFKDAAEVSAALAQDPDAAAEKYGISAGLGTPACYLIVADGWVVSAGDNGIGIALTKDGPAEFLLSTGPVVGNTVRDCTGLLNGSEYASSQDFNDLASALNGIVEQEVVSHVKNLKPGADVSFHACAAPPRHQVKTRPLKVIPLRVVPAFH